MVHKVEILKTLTVRQISWVLNYSANASQHCQHLTSFVAL